MLIVNPVYQKDDWTCGRAAITMLFQFYKTQVPKDLDTFCSKDEGIQPDAVKAILHRQYGHYTSSHMTLNILKGYLNDKKPVLAPITPDSNKLEDSHWVIVTGVTKKRVYYVCPIIGKTYLNHKDWLNAWFAWSGAALYLNWGVTSWPMSNSSIKCPGPK